MIGVAAGTPRVIDAARVSPVRVRVPPPDQEFNCVHVRILMTMPGPVVAAGYVGFPTIVPPKKLLIEFVFEYVTESYIESLDELTGHVRIVGAIKLGFVLNTRKPLPCSSVHADAIFVDEKVPSMVDTPDPNPLTPVEIGRPVQLVRVPDAGVPRIGVVEFVTNLPVVPEKVATWPDVVVPPVF